MAKLRMRAVLSAITAGILITIGGCTEQAPMSNSVPEDSARYQRLEMQNSAAGSAFDQGAVRVEKVIGAEGGTLEIPGGHTLAFPAGALSAPTRIRARIDPQYVEVDLGPDGLIFPVGHEPVLTLSYSNANAAAFRQLAIAYLNNSGAIVEILQTTDDAVKNTLTTRLRHFSRYASVGS